MFLVKKPYYLRENSDIGNFICFYKWSQERIKIFTSFCITKQEFITYQDIFLWLIYSQQGILVSYVLSGHLFSCFASFFSHCLMVGIMIRCIVFLSNITKYCFFPAKS